MVETLKGAKGYGIKILPLLLFSFLEATVIIGVLCVLPETAYLKPKKKKICIIDMYIYVHVFPQF